MQENIFNVYVYEPFENELQVLLDATQSELEAFLLNYKGWLNDLVIIKGKTCDSDSLLAEFGLISLKGKVSKPC
jgi:hypothetical protein